MKQKAETAQTKENAIMGAMKREMIYVGGNENMDYFDGYAAPKYMRTVKNIKDDYGILVGTVVLLKKTVPVEQTEDGWDVERMLPKVRRDQS